MNIGVIATRYARALYSLAFDQGEEDKVYTEMKCMLQQFISFPELKQTITSPAIKMSKKLELLIISAGGNDISPTTKKFIDFVVRRDKQEIIQFMCSAYRTVYCKEKNILTTRFISASKVDKPVLDKIKADLEKAYNANVELEATVDESLIGGFILDVDNNRLDASVAGELNKMRVAFKKQEN